MADKAESLEKKVLNFGSILTEMETLIDTLEHPDTSLESSLLAFEKGVKLTRDAQVLLTTTEQKVQALIDVGGELEVQDFAQSDSDL